MTEAQLFLLLSQLWLVGSFFQKDPFSRVTMIALGAAWLVANAIFS